MAVSSSPPTGSLHTVLHANGAIAEIQLNILWEDLRGRVKASPWQYKFHLRLLLLVYQKRNFHPTQTSQNALENFCLVRPSLEVLTWTCLIWQVTSPIREKVSLYWFVLQRKLPSPPLCCCCFLWVSELLRSVCLSPGLGCPVVTALWSTV